MGSDNPFIQEIQGELMKQSGIISSSDSKIEGTINSAIDKANSAAGKNRQRLESEHQRERGYLLERNRAGEETFLENRMGYATPVVAFSALQEQNAKAVRDLDMRKNELILMGDAEAAKQVGELTLKKLEFEQNAAERTFNALLAVGNFSMTADREKREAQNQVFTQGMAEKQFGLSEKQFDLAVRGQSFQEKSAMGSIALQYGITLEPGDDIASVVERAAPFASKEQKLKMEQMAASIYASNASAKASLAAAAKAAREDRDLDSTQLDALAAAYRTPNGAAIVAASVKDPGMLSEIFSRSSNLEINDVVNAATMDAKDGLSLEEALDSINNNPAIQNKTLAVQKVTEIYAMTPSERVANNLPSQIGAGAVGYSRGVNSFLEYLTGIPAAGKY